MRKAASVFGLVSLVVVLSSLGLHSQARPAQAVDEGGAPIFKVDPFWPKRLPNKWSMQQVTGIFIDPSNDHVWFLNRAAAANPDETGGANGRPRLLHPGTRADRARSGRATSSTRGAARISSEVADRAADGHRRFERLRLGRRHRAQDSILKFTRDGKLVWDFGHRPPADGKDAGEQSEDRRLREQGTLPARRSRQRDLHHQPAPRARVRHDHGRVQARVGRPRDAAQRDHQRSDSRSTSGRAVRRRKKRTSCPTCTSSRSRRTARCTSASAARTASRYSRPTASSCRSSTCRRTRPPSAQRTAAVSTARTSRRAGRPTSWRSRATRSRNISTWLTAPMTRCGSSIAHSGKTIGSFGRNGTYAGQFHWINAIVMDSKGNIYTGEVEENKRIQKFVPVMAGARR